MPTYPVMQILEDGTRTFEKPVGEILDEVEYDGALQVLRPEQYITYRQRAWFKGILLPALAAHSGDSKDWWETRLKTQVMPDVFSCRYVAVGKEVWRIVPSIRDMSKNRMTQLIKGSVAHLHDKTVDGEPVPKPIYKGEYAWVKLPNRDLRS